MLPRLLTFFLIAFTGVVYTSADVNFSIRYYDKSIYYPEDPVELKLTLTNTAAPGSPEETFYLADDLRQSFGFNLQSLTGQAIPQAEGYASALNASGPYRIVHLAPGQALSMVVTLNDWVDIAQAEQYRLTSFFYPRLRGVNMGVSQADTVLDLTVLPQNNNQWMDKLDNSIRDVLISRNLDPLNVVRETFEYRSASKFSRAVIYLDLESLTRNSPSISHPETLEKALLKGSWKDLPGLDLPVTNLEILSSRIYKEEAAIHIEAVYETYGERFERNLRVFLHKKNGFWSIRRIETLQRGEVDDTLKRYGTPALNPSEVVSALIEAAVRGDWDIVFHYYSIDDWVKNLPEYSERWKDMNSIEHSLALADYRKKVMSGSLDSTQLPLADLEDWKIMSVNYTEISGSVVVSNTKVYSTLAGPMKQKTFYTFRLSRQAGVGETWVVFQYGTARAVE